MNCSYLIIITLMSIVVNSGSSINEHDNKLHRENSGYMAGTKINIKVRSLNSILRGIRWKGI